jgi:serine/threonine protein kinase
MPRTRKAHSPRSETEPDAPSTSVKLLDFGVAKLKEDAEGQGRKRTSWVTDRETAVGTLPYMAPEPSKAVRSTHERTSSRSG